MQNVPVWVVGNKADLCMNVLATMRSHRHDHHNPRPLLHSSQHQASSPYEDLTPAFKDLANMVRKQWKCSYIECSIKYNWRILPIFREIIKSLETSLIESNLPPPQYSPIPTHHHNQFHSSSVRAVEQPSNEAALTNRCPVPSDNHAGTSHNNSVCSIV